MSENQSRQYDSKKHPFRMISLITCTLAGICTQTVSLPPMILHQHLMGAQSDSAIQNKYTSHYPIITCHGLRQGPPLARAGDSSLASLCGNPIEYSRVTYPAKPLDRKCRLRLFRIFEQHFHNPLPFSHLPHSIFGMHLNTPRPITIKYVMPSDTRGFL